MGMIIIGALLICLLIHTLISYVFYKIIFFIFKNRVFAKILFLLILTCPFWDLMLLKGIKMFYQVTKLLEPKIYAYPEKDENGMIESVSFSEYLYIRKDKLLANGNYEEYDIYLHKEMKNFIKEFYELSLLDKKSTNNLIVRFNMKSKTYTFSDEIQARYRLIKKYDNRFFGLFTLFTYNLVDMNNNILLGKYYRILFDTKFSSFRQKVLFLPNEFEKEVFHIRPIINTAKNHDTLIKNISGK